MVKYLNQKGVSLVEVMITVVIAGLLITIAIPQYQKFKRKGRQSEAKFLLSKLYTVETLFIDEWMYGTPNFFQMGFHPEGDIFYNVGWPETNNTKGSTINETSVSSLPTNYKGPYVHENMINNNKRSGANAFGLKKLTNIRGVCVNASSLCEFTGNVQSNQFNISSSLGGTDIQIDNTNAPGKAGTVTFTIGARAHFTGNNNSDEWTINHNKVLKNVKSGI